MNLKKNSCCDVLISCTAPSLRNKHIRVFCVCVWAHWVLSLTAFYTHSDARALRFHGNGSSALIHTVAQEFFNVGFFAQCHVRNQGEKNSVLQHTHTQHVSADLLMYVNVL